MRKMNQNQKPEKKMIQVTRNAKPEIRNPKPEIQKKSIRVTRNLKQGDGGVLPDGDDDVLRNRGSAGRHPRPRRLASRISPNLPNI